MTNETTNEVDLDEVAKVIGDEKMVDLLAYTAREWLWNWIVEQVLSTPGLTSAEVVHLFEEAHPNFMPAELVASTVCALCEASELIPFERAPFSPETEDFDEWVDAWVTWCRTGTELIGIADAQDRCGNLTFSIKLRDDERLLVVKEGPAGFYADLPVADAT